MKLNHLNLTVTDAVAAKNFLIKYFGFRVETEWSENKNFTIVRDDNGLVLTLMKAARNTEVQYPATFHIRFFQGSETEVDAMYERFQADGFEVEPPQRAHAWTFYIQAPGGFTIEIAA